MDTLDNHLNPHTKRPYHPVILAAMKLARKKINRYYSMTDLSSAYRIAMGEKPSRHLSCFIINIHYLLLLVLHPGLKLEYFRQQNWEESWIENAEDLVRKEYLRQYEGKHGPAPAPDTTDSVSDPMHLTKPWN